MNFDWYTWMILGSIGVITLIVFWAVASPGKKNGRHRNSWNDFSGPVTGEDKAPHIENRFDSEEWTW